MADQGNTETITIAQGTQPSLRAACVGFLSSTLGITVLMVLLSHV
jgi:hypothetical protein